MTRRVGPSIFIGGCQRSARHYTPGGPPAQGDEDQDRNLLPHERFGRATAGEEAPVPTHDL